jgi:hypothetical protein
MYLHRVSNRGVHMLERTNGTGRMCRAYRIEVFAGILVVLSLLYAVPVTGQVHVRVDLRCLTQRLCLDEPMSPTEPHGAVCANCHDMVAQRTLGEVRTTCSGAGCHERPEFLTPFHRGLSPGTLSNCVGCHDPHDVVVPGGGANCLACHTPGVRMAEPRSFERHALPGRPSALDLTFRHRQHAQVECQACHSSERAHGRTFVAGLRDCRSCHHTQPLASNCASCHSPREVASLDRWVTRTMDIQVGSLNQPRRLLPFDHVAHERIQCTACHTGGLSLSAAATDCSSCHAAHHQPNVTCMDCHRQPAPDAHTRDAHLGCAGSGCHLAAPPSVRDVPRTRQFCLSCHQDLVDHRPEGNCAECHVLPRPRIGR